LLEAEITGGLEHPGIVPVYGLGAYPDGRPFYAMRFIHGDRLQDAIADFHKPDNTSRPWRDRTLALRQLLGRFIDVCDAIAYAHSRGVLHRDLKPGNVMLGRFGETLVVDWGLAKPRAARVSDGIGTAPFPS
jgi:serine/threonine protein kinase